MSKPGRIEVIDLSELAGASEESAVLTEWGEAGYRLVAVVGRRAYLQREEYR